MTTQWVYGIHSVTALLANPRHTIHEVFVLEGRRDARMQTLLAQLSATMLPVHAVARARLDQWAEGANHQGVIAKVTLGEWTEAELPQLLQDPAINFLLILDGVEDPHNLGACLRTADAAGVHAVIAPKRHAAPLTATARKVACGAAEAIPYIQVTNLARTLRLLQAEGFWLYGLAGEADKLIYQAKLTGRLGLVLGAEEHGLRHLTREHCDELLAIPQQGQVASLNVSVAAGVCLFEVVRQRIG